MVLKYAAYREQAEKKGKDNDQYTVAVKGDDSKHASMTVKKENTVVMSGDLGASGATGAFRFLALGLTENDNTGSKL